ncbi:MAG: DNA repair protein RecN [Bacteroidales bacterium]|jgi:DNA repair protein RecN (Recombination protein N)|nr:DNA repair protein RecN [Bacteroidales bacterium]
MLRALHIANYAFIESLHLSLDKGFTVITGETGAGKSILVGALSLILGARADSSILFNTSKKCIVEGEFDINNLNLEDFFVKNDIDFNRFTILRREITENGSRAFINDTPVTLAILKQFAEKLVDIHSQHHQLLINRPDFRLQTVDDFALLKEEIIQYQMVLQQFTDVEKELNNAKEKAVRERLEKDFLTFQSEELHLAKLFQGEQEELELQIAFLKNVEEIKLQLYCALQLLSEKEENCIQQLNEAKNACQSVVKYDEKIKEIHSRLYSIVAEVKDVAFELANKEETMEINPSELALCESRLDTLFRLQQKHSTKNERELLQKLVQIDEMLTNFENLETQIEVLQKEYEILLENLSTLAKNLSEKRKDAALIFEKEIEKKLSVLGMQDTVFKVEVSQHPTFTISGTDGVQFLFSANKGVPPTPVEKTASGGELSRIMLAVKSIISAASFMPTVIFDEIDTGVSGLMASKVAAVMHAVSLQRQLVAITHLPQIASCANVHLLVYKEVEDNKTSTKIKEIKEKERITEIAKMMTGNRAGEAALKAAKELLVTRYSLLFLLIIFQFVQNCFAQNRMPQNVPHFVYQTSFSGGVGMGTNFTGYDSVKNENITFEIQQLIAYQFNNYIFTGGGAGLDFWFFDKKTSSFIPIFANITVKLIDKKTSPFLFANVGYAFKWQTQRRVEEKIFWGTKAGFYFHGGAGVSLKFSEKLSLLFSAYYKMQQSANKYRETDSSLSETGNQLFHFAGIKIGILY